MKKKIILAISMACSLFAANSQTFLSLDSILNEIQRVNPELKIYDAEIRASNEAAKGARNWMPPEIGTGLWMVPYSPKYWKKGDDGSFGMGQYQVYFQQMFPNKRKSDADEKYLESVSSADVERKKAAFNNLIAEAKKNYYEWIIIKKKLAILDLDDKLLHFMITKRRDTLQEWPG